MLPCSVKVCATGSCGIICSTLNHTRCTRWLQCFCVHKITPATNLKNNLPKISVPTSTLTEHCIEIFLSWRNAVYLREDSIQNWNKSFIGRHFLCLHADIYSLFYSTIDAAYVNLLILMVIELLRSLELRKWGRRAWLGFHGFCEVWSLQAHSFWTHRRSPSSRQLTSASEGSV